METLSYDGTMLSFLPRDVWADIIFREDAYQRYGSPFLLGHGDRVWILKEEVIQSKIHRALDMFSDRDFYTNHQIWNIIDVYPGTVTYNLPPDILNHNYRIHYTYKKLGSRIYSDEAIYYDDSRRYVNTTWYRHYAWNYIRMLDNLPNYAIKVFPKKETLLDYLKSVIDQYKIHMTGPRYMQFESTIRFVESYYK